MTHDLCLFSENDLQNLAAESATSQTIVTGADGLYLLMIVFTSGFSSILL